MASGPYKQAPPPQHNNLLNRVCHTRWHTAYTAQVSRSTGDLPKLCLLSCPTIFVLIPPPKTPTLHTPLRGFLSAHHTQKPSLPSEVIPATPLHQTPTPTPSKTPHYHRSCRCLDPSCNRPSCSPTSPPVAPPLPLLVPPPPPPPPPPAGPSCCSSVELWDIPPAAPLLRL
jgi:hypothetical protein